MNDKKLLQMIASTNVQMRCLGISIMCAGGEKEVMRIFEEYGIESSSVLFAGDAWYSLHGKVIPNIPAKCDSWATYFYCEDLDMIFSNVGDNLEVWRYKQPRPAISTVFTRI